MQISFNPDSFEDESLEQIISIASRMGFDAIELAGKDGLIIKEIADIIKSHSVKVAAVTSWFGSGDVLRDFVNPDPTVRRAGIKYGKYLIDLAREFGQMTDLAPITTNEVAETYDKQKLMIEAKLSIKELAEYAKDSGVKLLLESHNRFVVKPDICLINKQKEALELIRSLDIDSLGILLDTFHCSIEENDIVDTIYKVAKQIMHVHLRDSNRYLPGSGQLHVKPILQALKSVNYDGYLSLEAWPKPRLTDLENSVILVRSHLSFLD